MAGKEEVIARESFEGRRGAAGTRSSVRSAACRSRDDPRPEFEVLDQRDQELSRAPATSEAREDRRQREEELEKLGGRSGGGSSSSRSVGPGGEDELIRRLEKRRRGRGQHHPRDPRDGPPQREREAKKIVALAIQRIAAITQLKQQSRPSRSRTTR